MLRHLRISRALCQAPESNKRWPKAQVVKTLSNMGLHHTDVFVLEDEDVIASLATGAVPEALAEDIARLVQRPVVVRLDTLSGSADEELLLSHSDCLFSADRVYQFLVSTAADHTLKASGSPLAFLLHNFIVARSRTLPTRDPRTPE